jgi:hypothetical protein
LAWTLIRESEPSCPQPEPIPLRLKNDRFDFWVDLGGWHNEISSVQARPFKDKHPDVRDYIDDRTVTVGLN